MFVDFSEYVNFINKIESVLDIPLICIHSRDKNYIAFLNITCYDLTKFL